MSARARPPQVYLHIGPPKTGTTYIQTSLESWQSELRSAGVTLPGGMPYDHFWAALDARGNHSFGFGAGGDVPLKRAAGAWPRLVAETLKSEGTVVISHELFATADAAHARAAVEDLAATELHIVVTARDPERQLVSAWQQRTKNGQARPFRKTARRVAHQQVLHETQRIPDLLEKWGSTLPADRLHVVTVPPSGSDPTLLWRRFADAVGIDVERFSAPESAESNKTLGTAQIELLRRVNVALDGRIPHPRYGRIVTQLYAETILAGTPASEPPTLPKRLWPVVDAMAEDWIARIEKIGCQVHGELDDLRPAHREGAKPGSALTDDVADVAALATAELLLEIDRLDRWRSMPRRVAALATDTVRRVRPGR